MKNKILKTCLLSVAILTCLLFAFMVGCKSVTEYEDRIVGTYAWGSDRAEFRDNNTGKFYPTSNTSDWTTREFEWHADEETNVLTILFDDNKQEEKVTVENYSEGKLAYFTLNGCTFYRQN